MVNKILYRERLFEQKHKQWSTKYYTENDYLSKNTNNSQQNTIQRTTIWAKTQTIVSKILYRKQLFEEKHKQWSTKYYIENDYLSKNTNNGQQNTIQKTTIWGKTQTMVNKILNRKRLLEQKHKQWSTRYNTENDYLSKNTNNGQQNTIQKTTIWVNTQTLVNKIQYRKRLFE
jgi:membrane-bound inhibitor of C-type lysozyme